MLNHPYILEIKVPVDHGEWSFFCVCVAEFRLPVFYAEFLQPYSSGILAYGSFQVVAFSDFGITVMWAS